MASWEIWWFDIQADGIVIKGLKGVKRAQVRRSVNFRGLVPSNIRWRIRTRVEIDSLRPMPTSQFCRQFMPCMYNALERHSLGLPEETPDRGKGFRDMSEKGSATRVPTAWILGHLLVPDVCLRPDSGMSKTDDLGGILVALLQRPPSEGTAVALSRIVLPSSTVACYQLDSKLIQIACLSERKMEVPTVTFSTSSIGACVAYMRRKIKTSTVVIAGSLRAAAESHFVGMPGFGAVAVVMCVFPYIPAYTLAGFCVCCLFALAWLLHLLSFAFEE